MTKTNPQRKRTRAIKRHMKMANYKPNGEREVARRKRQISKGSLKVS